MTTEQTAVKTLTDYLENKSAEITIKKERIRGKDYGCAQAYDKPGHLKCVIFELEQQERL